MSRSRFQGSLDANRRPDVLGNAPRIEVAILKHRSIIHVARVIASPELMPNTGSSIRKGRTSHPGYSRPEACSNLEEKAMRLCQRTRAFHYGITTRRIKQVSNTDGTHGSELYHAQKDVEARCPLLWVPYQLGRKWKKGFKHDNKGRAQSAKHHSKCNAKGFEQGDTKALLRLKTIRDTVFEFCNRRSRRKSSMLLPCNWHHQSHQ